MCVIQDAAIGLRTVSCVCSNTSSRRRMESCSSQLLLEFSAMLFIWLSFFHFTPPVSYFIPSQNSLFPLQAVNCVHATASPPHALHVPSSWLWPSWYWSGTWWWSCSPNRLAGLAAFVERCLHIHSAPTCHSFRFSVAFFHLLLQITLSLDPAALTVLDSRQVFKLLGKHHVWFSDQEMQECWPNKLSQQVKKVSS